MSANSNANNITVFFSFFQDHAHPVTQEPWSPKTQATMDWALDQILQDNDPGLIKNNLDYVDQLHNLLTHTEEESTILNLLSPPPAPFPSDIVIKGDEEKDDEAYEDIIDDNVEKLPSVLHDEALDEEFPSVLSPPEQYRDHHNSSPEQRSLTQEIGCYPDVESIAKPVQEAIKRGKSAKLF